ncbi:hypothetical protein KXW50_009275, partial [Aspergillus fumigatus]
IHQHLVECDVDRREFSHVGLPARLTEGEGGRSGAGQTWITPGKRPGRPVRAGRAAAADREPPARSHGAGDAQVMARPDVLKAFETSGSLVACQDAPD